MLCMNIVAYSMQSVACQLACAWKYHPPLAKDFYLFCIGYISLLLHIIHVLNININLYYHDGIVRHLRLSTCNQLEYSPSVTSDACVLSVFCMVIAETSPSGLAWIIATLHSVVGLQHKHHSHDGTSSERSIRIRGRSHYADTLQSTLAANTPRDRLQTLSAGKDCLQCYRSSSSSLGWRQYLGCAYITRIKIGDRIFTIAGPTAWNSLPAELLTPTHLRTILIHLI